MARVVLPIAGAVIGSFFGMPQVGFAIGSILASVVDPVKIKAPEIGDLAVQLAREGAPIPIIYGTVAISGNLIWVKDARVVKKSSSGKGGPKVETNTIFRSFAIGLGEGPIGGILRVWEDEKLVYDVRAAPDIPLADSTKFAAGMTIHLGAEDQLQDAEIQANEGLLAPFHRGLAYVVFPNMDLTGTAGRIPIYRFEVSGPQFSVQQSEPIFWQQVLVTEPDKSFALGSDTSGLTDDIIDVSVGTSWRVFLSSDNGASWTSVPIINNITFSGNNSPTTTVHPALMAGVWGFVSVSSGRVVISNSRNPTSFTFVKGPIQQFQIFPCMADRQGAVHAYTAAPAHAWQSSDWLNWTDNGLLTGFHADDNSVTFCAARNGVTILTSPKHLYKTSDPNGVALTEITTTEMQTLVTASAQFGSPMWDVAANRFIVPMKTLQTGVSHVYFSSATGVDWQLESFNDQTLTGDSTKSSLANTMVSTKSGWFGIGNLSGGGDAKVYRTNAPDRLNLIPPGDPVPVSAIIADIADRAQLPDVDVLQLDATVLGYALGGFFTAADAIRPLQQIAFFGVAEYDGVLHFLPRGGSAVATITEADLVEAPQSSRRSQALEFPRRVHLSYQSPTIGYETAKQTAERLSDDVRVTGERSLSTPAIVEEVQAARIVDILMKTAWTEIGGEVRIVVHDAFMRLTEGDIVLLDLRGRVRRLRIDQMSLDDGLIRLTCIADRQSAYSSTRVPDALPRPSAPASTNVGTTLWTYADIPALTDAADQLGGYFAATSVGQAWTGAVLQRSADGGLTFFDVIADDGAIMGAIVDPLPFAPEYFSDNTSSFRVALINQGDELEVASDLQLLATANAALVGDEVIQFGDAVDQGNGVWQLSRLLRGRKGSEPKAWPVGSRFVLLSTATFAPSDASDIGTNIVRRGVGIGDVPENASTAAAVYNGITQQELAPMILNAVLTGNSLALAWLPRDRFGTAARPVASINATPDTYWITVIGANSSVLSQTSTDRTASIDTTGLTAPLTITVQRVNRITGRGKPATRVVN